MSRIEQAGRNAEDDARWHLDRCFGQSKNWRVIHDLTLPDHRSSSPCQIDHVVIGRLADVIVLETKSAVNGMKLDPKTGAWAVYHNGRPKPMASPIAQNIRHIEVLAHHFKENSVFPRRLGIPIKPTFHSWILVQPGVSLPLEYDKAWIVQRDQVEKRFDQFISKVGALDVLSMMGRDELDDVSRFLQSFQSKPVDLKLSAAREDSEASVLPRRQERKRGTFCESCEAEIDSKVAAFCRFNAFRLGGKYLCRDCQRLATE